MTGLGVTVEGLESMPPRSVAQLVAHPPGVGEVTGSILGPNCVVAKVVPTAAM